MSQEALRLFPEDHGKPSVYDQMTPDEVQFYLQPVPGQAQSQDHVLGLDSMPATKVLPESCASTTKPKHPNAGKRVAGFPRKGDGSIDRRFLRTYERRVDDQPQDPNFR